MRPPPAGAAGAVPGSGRAAGRRLVRRIGRDERRRVGGVAGDRLAGVEHVEIAALDRGLGLDLAAAAPGLTPGSTRPCSIISSARAARSSSATISSRIRPPSLGGWSARASSAYVSTASSDAVRSSTTAGARAGRVGRHRRGRRSRRATSRCAPARSPTWRRKRSTSRVAAMNRPARRRTRTNRAQRG